ncbi:hypothetical protein CsSME_00035204 [Camellia sinensis var. sinensis]
MWTGYKEQPKNAWKTKGLALPTIFAIDEFFRHNEDTKWAVKELERRPYQDLHGDLSPEAIVNDMCKCHFGSDRQSTCRVHLPPQMWLIDSIFHFNVWALLESLYKIEKGYWVFVPDLIWAEMDKLHKGLVCSVYASNSDKSTACPSSCAYSSGTVPAPFQMTSEQYEQLCQEVRGLRQDVIAYRTQSQQDFLEFRSQYQQDMLDLRSLLQAILDAQQRPPRSANWVTRTRRKIKFQHFSAWARGAETELALNPTDGFTNIPLTESNFKLQKPYDIPLEQRCSFQNGVHRLWVYADDKPYNPSSPTQPRTEIRILVLSLHLNFVYIYMENSMVYLIVHPGGYRSSRWMHADTPVDKGDISHSSGHLTYVIRIIQASPNSVDQSLT